MKIEQIRCKFPDISYLSETQKNNFQFLSDRITSAKILPVLRCRQRTIKQTFSSIYKSNDLLHLLHRQLLEALHYYLGTCMILYQLGTQRKERDKSPLSHYDITLKTCNVTININPHRGRGRDSQGGFLKNR